MGFPQTDFGSLVQALYGIEEGISRGLWADSSPSDSKGKKPGSGSRPSDVGAIGMTGHRSPRHPPFQRQFLDSLPDDRAGSVQTSYSFQAGWAYFSTSATTASICYTDTSKATCIVPSAV